MNQVIAIGGYPIEVVSAAVVSVKAGERTEKLTVAEADKLYREYWRLQTITHNVHGAEFCYCCGEPASGRSSSNVWGTIIDFPSCEGCHAKWNKRWCDSVPCAWSGS